MLHVFEMAAVGSKSCWNAFGQVAGRYGIYQSPLSLSTTQQSLHHPVKGEQLCCEGWGEIWIRANGKAAGVVVVVAAVVVAACVCGGYC